MGSWLGTRKLVLLIGLMGLPSPVLWGDSPGIDRQQSWKGDFPVWLDRGAHCVEQEAYDAKGQPVRERTLLQWEDGRTALGWGDIWHLRPMNKAQALYRSESGKMWTMMGTLRLEDSPKAFVPLAQDRLLLLASKSPFVLDGKASSLGVARRKDDGDYVLEKLIQPLSKPLLERVAQPGEGIPENASSLFQINRDYMLFAFHTFVFNGALFIPLPKGAAMVSYYTGHIWIFDEKGEIRRHVTLFDGLSEARFPQLLAFESALLGVLPTQNGKILIASRSEEAVINARKKYPVVDYSSGKGVLVENSHENQMTAAFMYPEIQWWELDPETGKCTLQSPPPFGAPEELPFNREEAQLWLQGLNFHLTRQGDVVVDMGPIVKKHLGKTESQAPSSIGR